MKKNRFIFTAALVFLLQANGFADPASELASFSAFKNVDLSKMAGGEVLNTRLPSMSFSRGLSTRHPELKVYLHVELPAKPGPGDFSKISSAPDNSPVRSFFADTQKLDPSQLQMNLAEAKLFKPGSDPRAAACSFWSDLLYRRASAFASGGLPKEPPYNYNGESVPLTGEVERLLKDHPKIRTQFSALAGSLSGVPPVRQMYWEMSDVEGTAAVSLGAVCAKAPSDTWQAIDLHYYASSGYFVMLTFYQMWPVTTGSQPATLVWRCDLLSAPSLSELHGVERLASANAMTKEIHKTITLFLKDTKAK